MKNFLKYVNIKQGTLSEPRFSTGNTLPLTCAPFGMNSFALQTRASGGGWFYSPLHRQTEGIRLTHQPSPWVRDYAHFVLMPQSGEPYITEDSRSSSFIEKELSPACTEIYFKRYFAQMGIIPSERGAIIKIRWDTEKTPRLAVLPFDFTTELVLDPGGRTLTGFTNAYGDGTRKDFKFYFCMQFDKAVNTAKTYITKISGETEQGISCSGTGAGMNIAFDIPQDGELTVRLGTSYISPEYAVRNLGEVSGRTYEQVKTETEDKWNSLLSKIEIEDSEEHKRTFYSCLYRCFIFPRIFYEYDDLGRAVHYNTKSGEICGGKMFVDNGLWDVYRTLYPLLTLIIPEFMSDVMEGYLNFYKEQGWLPKWLSPGERGIMPGTLIDAALADCAVKGLLTEEQMKLALDGMLKNANTASGTHLYGRIGVEDYVKLGYVPNDKYGESVNNSLDAYYCDWCIAKLAEKLNITDLCSKYLTRSQGYKKLFDSKTGFIRGLSANGERKLSFSPYEWGGDYCEGGAYQNGFAVYHDIEGLAELYGGREKFEEKLDELFNAPTFFETGTYPCEIHEMTEMAAADFGQCAISNQPSMHLPYLYSMIKNIGKTALHVRHIVREGYNERAFPGDEDNGSMSAWYILSVLGFYPVCPGSGEYVLGISNAQRITVKLGSENTLHIINETEDITALKVSFNGTDITEDHIEYDKLMQGGTLRFYTEV